jgi:hypothetical protein
MLYTEIKDWLTKNEECLKGDIGFFINAYTYVRYLSKCSCKCIFL